MRFSVRPDAAESSTERLRSRLFGGKTSGERREAIVGIDELLIGKNAPEEAIPPARHRLRNPVDVDDIDTGVDLLPAHWAALLGQHVGGADGEEAVALLDQFIEVGDHAATVHNQIGRLDRFFDSS